MEAIHRGDQGAEAVLAQRYRERILVVAAFRTGDPDAAADLSHEVILAVIVALRNGRLRNPDSLPAFVCGTARNLINNYLRRRSLSREEPLSEGLRRETTATAADDGDRRRLVREAMRSLQPHEREILMMTLVEELKPGEIAARLDVSSEVVRARKSRALKRIRKQIRKLVTKQAAIATDGRGER